MRHAKVLISLVLSAIPFVTTNAQMSREEAVVRTTYAKLIYAVKIGTIHDFVVTDPNGSLPDLEDRLAAKDLRFQLSNFSSGRVAEISKRKFGDLVTKPAGEDVLDVSLGTYNFTEDIEATREVKETSETGAQANWSEGQNLAQDWNVPFEQMLTDIEVQNKSKYSRYAAYSVTISFEERSRSYRAMFLFGNGEVPVLAADNVTNHPALTGLISKSLYPRVLLESPLARKKAVAGWLKAHQVRDPACRPGQGEACCDPSSMRCGVAADDVDRAVDKAISRLSKRDRSTAKNLGGVVFSPRLLTVSATIPPPRVESSCDSFNRTANGLHATDSGTEEHTAGGSHSWNDQPAGSCTYTGSGACTATATATSNVGLTVSDGGGLTPPTLCHVKNSNYVNGSATGSNPTASTNAAAVIISCASGCQCYSTITFAGQNPTFPIPNLWNKMNPYSMNCPAKTAQGTPIIFDTTGLGFHLTSQESGVLFDLAATGTPIQISWTDGFSGNAFLALDRNGNGKIDNGKELFGNYTPQPPSDDPNGFLALAVFDDPASGGNGDGIVDERDAVWLQLRLWIDQTHDGISQPEELYTLPALGVYSIGLEYVHQRRYDDYGNLFRYRGTANPGVGPLGDTAVDSKVYDVILVTRPLS